MIETFGIVTAAVVLTLVILGAAVEKRRLPARNVEPPVVMHVMGGMTDPHGRWVVLMPGVRCDCPSTEHVDVTTRCGERATLHHCHKGDHT